MNIELFISTFFLMLLAELPDKTALATLLMATREKPLAIFVGVAAAFVVQTLVAVFLGNYLGLLPSNVVRYAASGLFFVFAILAWRRRNDVETDEAKGSEGKGFLKTAWAAFIVIFIAEWGDLTQLATATLVAKYQSPFTIFFAAVAGLWAATVVAIVAGRIAKNFISIRVLNRLAAVLFLGVGIYLLWGGSH